MSGEPRRVWKFGCNWEGNPNGFFDFIHDERIVLGRTESTPYAIDDLVLICQGFTVRAIAEVLTEPTSIMNRPDLRVMEDEFGVSIERATIVAKAKWCILRPDEQFKYPIQRGACRVRNPKVIERALALWDTSR